MEQAKKLFQKTILNLKFKFQAQDSFLEYYFFEIWIFGDLENESHFLKKATFSKKISVRLYDREKADVQGFTWII